MPTDRVGDGARADRSVRVPAFACGGTGCRPAHPLGDGDGCEVTRAQQAGQFDGVSPVGFHPIAWLFGDQRGSDDPADVAFVGAIGVEPIATRAGFINKDEVWAFGLEPADEVINVTLSRPDGAEGDDLGVVFVGDIGDGDRLFMDIHSDVEHARLVHG
jgi:hypothetical protein